ncbi:MAG TPA: tetratricopeptide repeat protein [Blastocatellia bacterium]|nr:tetratricopeptide repeat protein [Blastocatellia bacterium]
MFRGFFDTPLTTGGYTKNSQMPRPACGARILIVIVLLSGFGYAQARSAATAGDTATGALKVKTGQPASVVFINDVRHGTAGENGDADLPRVKTGTFRIRVQSVGFVDWMGTVAIAAGSSKTITVPPRAPADEATVHFQKAEQLRSRGKNRDAVEEYKQALEKRSSFPEARIGITRCMIPLQNFQEAEKHISLAIRTPGKTQAEAQTVLANMRRFQGLHDEAIAEYRKAIRISGGTSAEAHIGLGIALKETGNLEGSIREYRLGIARDMDTEPILYYQLGEILEQAKHPKEAIDAYRAYLRLDPEGEYASAVESIIERLKEEAR